MTKLRSTLIALCASTCLQGWAVAEAASVYLTPANSSVSVLDGTAALQLFMDFSDEATLGGGIDLTINGPVSLVGFTPSSYFNTLDTAFSGYSTAPGTADNDLAVWFGDFDGLSGVNELGTITLNLFGAGAANVGMGINSLYGPFQSAVTISEQNVLLSGAIIEVTPVPLPAAFWLLISGVGALCGFSARRANPRIAGHT